MHQFIDCVNLIFMLKVVIKTKECRFWFCYIV